ncbi:MAG: FAD-dependent oxidoreductase, partial [candidate division Zixibacteria bacterium]|nr:FAD-dependent oxidoreductase [candidate division Zixibacteria bacterium]
KKVIVQTKGGNKEILCDKVLVSVGRKAYTENLNLDTIGIKHNKGQILVDKYLRTNLPHIFAIGDCIGNYLLAHVASMEGEIAVENAILNRNKEMDYSCVPRCIFTLPELASVGISEKEAKDRSLKIKVGKFPFLANGKAQAENETEGMVKIITDENGKILGGHILGNRATDLVAELALGMKNGISAGDFIETIHAHPTLPEAVREAFLKLEDRPLHIL